MALTGSRTYSARLGEISGEQLERACERVGCGSVERAEPASDGLWGQNILLATTTGEYVLRGNPTAPHQLHKERAVADALHGRCRLAVPWPYLVVDDDDVFGWPYAVMPLLPGTSGASVWEAADDVRKVELAAAHGEALAALHDVAFEAAGPYDPDEDRFVPAGDHRAWTMARLDTLRAACRDAGGLTPPDETFVDEVLEAGGDTLGEPVDPVLVHHDFSLANTVYDTAGRRPTATGVFDLGEAHVGDGDEDLIRFLFRRKAGQREAFVIEYRRTHPARPGAAERLAVYALADLLFLWNVSRRQTNWFGDASFVDVAKPVLRNARTAGATT